MKIVFKAVFVIAVLAAQPVHAQLFKRKKAEKETRKREDEGRGQVRGNAFHEKFFNGMREYGLENYDKAAEAFLACIEMDRSSYASHYQLSKVYWDMGEKSKALVHAGEACNMQPGNEDIYQNYLYFLLQVRKFGDAINLTNQFLAQQTDDVKLIKYNKELSRFYEYNREPEKAAEVYNALESRYGYSDGYCLERLRIYRSNGLIAQALSETENLLQHNPGNTKYMLERAGLLSDKGNTDEALTAYNKVLELQPDNAEALLQSGQLLYSINPTESIVRLGKAFANRSNSAEEKLKAFNRLSQWGISADDKLKLAQIIYKSNGDSPLACKAMADAYTDLGKKKKAAPYLAEARSLDPSNFAFVQELIALYYEIGDYRNLLSESIRAVDLYPSQPSFYLYAGIAYMEALDFDNSLIMLETGKSYVLANNALRVQFQLTLAELFGRMGEYGESDKEFEKIINEFPSSATALNNYAYSLARRGQRLDEARKMSEKSMQLEGENASYLDTYGYILFVQKNYKDAVTYLQKALQKAPGSPEIAEHLGDALYMNGQADDALKYWKMAQEYGNESDLLQRKISDKKYYEK
ncbi:tetratricopeptide repeat protein [bacterium]|nr:tetratricopeptide repeat protein [bacterium]